MKYLLPKLIIFDLDGTLTESKRPLTRAMAHLLEHLLVHTKVAIISGGALSQFLSQIVARLSEDAELANLYLLPTSGAALYVHHHTGFDKKYEERISEEDAERIMAAMRQGASASGVVDLAESSWGPRVEYRGGQLTFSALGQDAPLAEKKAWDPNHAKRRALQTEIQKRLPKDFTASMGGANSIDVTKEGVDKAYGVHQLSEILHIPEKDMLYVGDELKAHGNDEAVFKTNAETKAVTSPTETARLIGRLLATNKH